MSQPASDNAITQNECHLGAPPASGKRRSSYGSLPHVQSAKRRRISLASVDLSREIQLPDATFLRTGTTADRFISTRPRMETPLNTTPRSTRVAKAWGLANDRVLKFSDTSSSTITPAPNGSIHNILRRNADELFQPAKSGYSSASASANIAKRMRITLALDGPGMPIDPFSAPISWSSSNYIAIACDDNVYYQNLDTRTVARLHKSYSLGDLHTIQWAGSFKPNLIAVGTKVGRVTLIDATTTSATIIWPDHKATSVGGMDWSDNILAVGRASGKISAFDSRQKGEVYGLYAGHDAHVRGVKWREDGIYLATGDENGIVQIWDVRAGSKALGGAEKGRKLRHQGAVKALAWCPWKSDLLATGSIFPEGTIRIWSTLSTSSTPTPQHTIHLNTSVTSLHWSPHCKELLSTHGSTWSLSPTPAMPRGPLKVIPSPLANSVTVHAYPSCQKLVSIPSHLGSVTHSCLSPDGTSVFTSSPWDESMKMWKIWGKREHLGKKESVFDKFAIR